MRVYVITPPAGRFFRHIEILESGCWRWTASLNRYGYGQFNAGSGKMMQAYKFAYVDKYGPVPQGQQLDHTCHDPKTCGGGIACPHRRCVNPDHLKPVTHKENHSASRSARPLIGLPKAVIAAAVRRRNLTSCKRGHDYIPESFYFYGNVRICRACKIINGTKTMARKKKEQESA